MFAGTRTIAAICATNGPNLAQSCRALAGHARRPLALRAHAQGRAAAHRLHALLLRRVHHPHLLCAT